VLALSPIQDLDAPELTIYKMLRDNAFTHDNSFIADSPKVVNMLLETPLEVKSILATQAYYDEHEALLKDKDIPQLFLADKKLMESIVGHKIHHNCMMHGIRPKTTDIEELGDQIIMLDQITSTENIGSIARSAAALGVNGYLLSKQGPHPYGRRALRVSMGHVSMLDIHLYEDIFITIDILKSRGYRIFGAEVTPNATQLSNLIVPDKWVLIMGHEGKGLSNEVIDACDEILQIEMIEGIKSFNVSVAASIMMYQFQNHS